MPTCSEIITVRRAGFCARPKARGNDLLLDIDVQGASQIMQRIPEAVSIFILPPDWETLERRLRSRGQDSEEVIRRRLDTARREIENYSKYDYILVNDLLEQSADQLKDIVLSERLQRSGAELSEEEKRRVESRTSLPIGTNARAGAADSGFVPQTVRGHSEVFGGESMKLVEGFDSNYRYILVAARRARQLQGGAPPVIDTGSRKPCRIAQDEIKAGKVKWLIPEIPKLPVVAASETLNKVFLEDA